MGIVIKSTIRGEHEKDLHNRLIDLSSQALSGVELIISQEVELSTVTFA